MIELRAVSKRYGEVEALQPTTIAFAEGTTTALIGPSGCGKSTLLRTILGLIEPTSGEVVVDGAPVTPANRLEVRRRFGYVIQDGGLFPHLTARGNITLMARHLGTELDDAGAHASCVHENNSRLEELCRLTHFPTDGLERYPAELSGGQRQRVSLMRALALDPQALLLDEPLGALDPLIRASLQQDLKGLFSELGKTVVMVTHDMPEAAYLADEIVLMREGAIVQRGSAEELRQSPAIEWVTEFMDAQAGVHAI